MQPIKLFIQGFLVTDPFFYIIRHISSGKLYAGYSSSKKRCNSSTLMTACGYQTSSKIVKQLIITEGLYSFEIDRIRHFDNGDAACKYEARFLCKVNAMRNSKFINQTNGGKEFRSKPGADSIETRYKKGNGSRGKKFTEEHNKKISDFRKTFEYSIESCEKISKSNTGKKRTLEDRLKRSEFTKGRRHTEETKIKQSIAHKGKVRSEEHQKNLTAALQNLPPASDDLREKRKINMTGRFWWTNGQNEKFCVNCPDEDTWYKGRSRK